VGAEVVAIIVVWLPSKAWHVGALVLVWLCAALGDLASSTLLWERLDKLVWLRGQSPLPLLKLLKAVTMGGMVVEGARKIGYPELEYGNLDGK
jgi:hypothetical protein